MSSDMKKAESLQKQGTREFDEAVAGKGPAMPPKQADRQEDAELTEALEDTFPASDPVKAAAPKTALGAPKGRQSVE